MPPAGGALAAGSPRVIPPRSCPAGPPLVPASGAAGCVARPLSSSEGRTRSRGRWATPRADYLDSDGSYARLPDGRGRRAGPCGPAVGGRRSLPAREGRGGRRRPIVAQSASIFFSRRDLATWPLGGDPAAAAGASGLLRRSDGGRSEGDSCWPALTPVGASTAAGRQPETFHSAPLIGVSEGCGQVFLQKCYNSTDEKTHFAFSQNQKLDNRNATLSTPTGRKASLAESAQQSPPCILQPGSQVEGECLLQERFSRRHSNSGI